MEGDYQIARELAEELEISTNGSKPELKEAVTDLYGDGRTEKELIVLSKELSKHHRLGPAWLRVNQQTVNRWLSEAKRQDPDLEIWHLLNRRDRVPGLYTHWQPVGLKRVLISHDGLTGIIYLAPGVDFFPSGQGAKPIQNSRGRKAWRESKSEAMMGYVWPLWKEFGYSYRDIAKLSNKKSTRYPDRDKTPVVEGLTMLLEPMSYSTIRRIIQRYLAGQSDLQGEGFEVKGVKDT